MNLVEIVHLVELKKFLNNTFNYFIMIDELITLKKLIQTTPN